MVSQESERTLIPRHEHGELKESLAHYILQWWRGDAHTHSQESTREGFGHPEGIYDLDEIMEYYQSLGLEFVCLTEHASHPGHPERQSVESPIAQSLLQEAQRIEAINHEHKKDIVALSGVESSIFFGEDDQPILDIPDEVVEKLDVVIASRHAITREKELDAIRETLLFAIHHPSVDVIGHPDRYTRKDKEISADYWTAYWALWPELVSEMARNHKAFEINLNNPPAPKLIEMAARAGVLFFINYDAHDFSQYKKEESQLNTDGEKVKKQWARGVLSDDEHRILEQYKIERLASGPGVVALVRLVRWIKRLEALGVTPDRVINSSRDTLLHFLIDERRKKTPNLDFLNTHGHRTPERP